VIFGFEAASRGFCDRCLRFTPGSPQQVQGSLPSARHTFPGRIGYLQGHTKRFQKFFFPLPQALPGAIYFKDPRPFFNPLHIFFAAVAVFDAIIYILRRDEQLFKSLLDGIKPTWRNIFSQLKEGFHYNIFGFI
jgi:hypothetical protein